MDLSFGLGVFLQVSVSPQFEINRKRTSNWGETVCLIAKKRRVHKRRKKTSLVVFLLVSWIDLVVPCVFFSKHRYYIYIQTERGGERERDRRGHKILGGALSVYKDGA